MIPCPIYCPSLNLREQSGAQWLTAELSKVSRESQRLWTWTRRLSSRLIPAEESHISLATACEEVLKLQKEQPLLVLKTMDDDDVDKHPFNNSQSRARELSCQARKGPGGVMCHSKSPGMMSQNFRCEEFSREVSKTFKEAVAT